MCNMQPVLHNKYPISYSSSRDRKGETGYSVNLLCNTMLDLIYKVNMIFIKLLEIANRLSRMSHLFSIAIAGVMVVPAK